MIITASRSVSKKSGAVHRQTKLYVLAAAIHLNPQRLGLMLRERIAMPPDIAARLREALGPR